MDSNLKHLLAEAKEHLALMTPGEKSSMYACQALNLIISETVFAIREEYQSKRELRDRARATIGLVIGILRGNEVLIFQDLKIARYVWRLIEKDRLYILREAEKALSQIDQF